MPIGLAVAGANVNDFKLLRETIESIPVVRPRPTHRSAQGMCLDKGYDYVEVRDLLDAFRFTAHIRSRGEELKLLKRSARFKARRWVCERTHSWMNRFRREELRHLMDALRSEPPGRPTPQRQLQIFEQAFGDVDRLERLWLRHEMRDN